MAMRLLLSRLLEERHELITLIEGEGSTGGRHPQDQRVAAARSTPTSRSRCTTAASPSTPTCWASSRRAGRVASPRTLRDLSLRPVSVLKTVSARKAAQLEQWGVESVLDLLTTFPRKAATSTARPRPTCRDSRWGRRRPSWPRCGGCASGGGGYNRSRKAPVTITVRDDTGTMEVVFFNQPWRAKQLREGTEAIFWGKVGDYRGTRQMVNPVVDVVAGVDDAGGGPAAPDPADPARLPGLGQGRPHQLGDRHLRGGGARAGGRVRRPAARRMADVAGPVGPHGGHAGHPRARVDGRDRAGPAPADLRRAVPPPAGPGPAPAGLRAQRPGPAPRRVPPGDHRRRRRHPGRALPRPRCPSS